MKEKARTRPKKDTPDTPVVLMDFLIKSSSRGMAALYFTPDLLLLNTLFHSSKVSSERLMGCCMLANTEKLRNR